MSEESRKHNSHAAESWRELAGDVRQWADGHRLAITATVALVVLNLVVWLVVAMAGFAFPLRLDTSMAEFDFGKLFCTLFLARGVIQLILDAALWLVMLSIAEPWLGRARTVGTALACALGGVIVGLTLCAAAGWLFQDSQFVSRMQFALSPLVLPVGALMAASAFCSHLLRRRIRLIGYVAILVALLYSGNPGDYCILAAALIGHAAGRVMAGPPAHAETGWHWLRSTSFEARRMFAAIAVVLALGPIIAITSHNHAGPLSTVGLLMSPVSVDDGTLARCLAGATHSGCFLQFDLLRASMPGAVLRSLLPTAVTLVLACAAVYLMYGIAQPDEFSPRATASSLLAELPGRFLPIGFLSHMKLSFVPRTPMASIVYQGVGLVFWIVVLVVVIRWMSDVSESNERAQARAERLVETGGESMSFMTTWEGNSYWLSPTGKSAVAYRVLNGIALTCTGPFGEPSEWMDDLTGFTQYCVERSLSPVFYSVHREQRDALLEAGWSSIEVGSEMVVDPRGWKTTGKKWQDVRTAINKAKRDGVTDVQSTFLEASLDVREQIEDISEEWAQLKALPEMKFTLGGVEELRDPRVRLLYAIDADGRVLGVTSWLPTWRDGRIVGWTLDFMRHRTDSPNGIMEFLIARMAERLRDEGLADPEHAVEFMSLSAAPLAGMNPERDNAREGGVAAGEGTQVLQHALQIVADWMEPAYGFHSLFNFKRKFQPAEAPVYVCYPDPAALPQIGLAVVRAYVPSVTPAEVAGMLSTLRS